MKMLLILEDLLQCNNWRLHFFKKTTSGCSLNAATTVEKTPLTDYSKVFLSKF